MVLVGVSTIQVKFWGVGGGTNGVIVEVCGGGGGFVFVTLDVMFCGSFFVVVGEGGVFLFVLGVSNILFYGGGG